MKIRTKEVVTLRLRGEAETGARTRVSARSHQLLVDEPSERGGSDQGLTPTETLLAALAGCTNRIAHTVAGRHGIELSALEVEVSAQFDRRCLSEDLDVPFPEIENRITITTAASDSEIEKVKEDLPRFCPVSKVIRQSGTKLTDVWRVNRR